MTETKIVKNGQDSVRVIDRVELPTRMPIAATAISWLLLDRLEPNEWIWGAYWALIVFGWLLWLIRFWQEEQLCIFEDLEEIMDRLKYPKRIQ